MMDDLTQREVSCPYCGESIDVLIDPEESGQQYIEDCQVCCKPITFSIAVDNEGQLLVSVYAQDETF
jgi:hypothetical protein